MDWFGQGLDSHASATVFPERISQYLFARVPPDESEPSDVVRLMTFVTVHEILHTLGGEHVDKKATGNVMNPGLQLKWRTSPPTIGEETKVTVRKSLQLK
jgi:hypothetical protein